MTQLMVLTLDADTAGHVAVAIHRHRAALRERGLVEPQGLADLETAATSVSKRQQASPASTVTDVCQCDLDDGEREYLTRKDVQQLTGTSLSTVDRWIKDGDLPSRLHGRTRRIYRSDLDQFLRPAA